MYFISASIWFGFCTLVGAVLKLSAFGRDNLSFPDSKVSGFNTVFAAESGRSIV